MVYSGGVRSFVQAAAVCALALSALPSSIEAKGTTTPAPTQAQVTCGISDGDKQVGIQVINDNSCTKGGLGCYNNHCRYCKVLDTPKSSHLDTCISHGVAFTTTSTVAVTRGPCEVSSGDVAAGIAAVTDSGCLYGGLGCFNDHCRFCKVVETPQSAGFMTCSSLDSSYSPVATLAPTAAPTVAPTPVPTVPPTTAPAVPATAASSIPPTTLPPTLSPTVPPSDVPVTVAPTIPPTDAPATEAPTIPPTDVPVTEAPTAPPSGVPLTEAPTAPPTDTPATEAPSTEAPATGAPVSQSTCSIVPSAGDHDAGVSIVSDPSCASGGLGCLSDVCRFCKLKTTPQSDPYMDCALVNGEPTATEGPPTTAIPGTEAPSVTPSSADTEAPAATATTSGETEAPVSTESPTEAPTSSDASTEAPLDTEVPTEAPIDSEVPTEAPVDTDAPTEAPVNTDAPTEAPVDTEAPTDAPSEAPVETGAPTEAPVDTEAPTDAPVDTIVPTEAPVVTSAPSAPATTCTLVASAEDASQGISVGTDPSCSSGGVGCIDEICRFCKVTTSLQSAPYIDCALLENGSSKSEVPAVNDTVPPSDAPAATPDSTPEVPTTTTETPEAPTEAPSTAATDAPDASTETPAIDIDAPNAPATDAPNATTETPATDAPIAATDAPTATETPVAPTDAPVSTAAALPDQQTCGIEAAAGDIAVGVHITTDLTCSAGGVGCINDLCRFCKVETTPQSKDFPNCNSPGGATSGSAALVDTATAPPVATTNASGTCALVASSGDASVGIRIVTDSTCSTGGVGCINDVCRFCKVITSAQSATFIDCSTIDDYTPETEVPAATTTPDAAATTPASASTCSRVASGGDIAVGVDIATDTTCRSGGVGCIDDVCRFCQVTNTAQSAAFINCTSLSGYTPRVEAPVSTAIASAAPATAASTNAPVSQRACGLVVSAGDAAVGISITSDATCASGGVGCIDSVCRFCKVTTTVQSAAFVDCNSIADFTLATDAPIADPTAPLTVSTAAAPTTSIPAGTCSLTVSEGDAAVGIDIFADTSCQFGGVGCIDNACRFCKTRTTDQSAAFVNCPVAITTNAPAATTAYSNTTLEPTTTDADVATPTDSTMNGDGTETPATSGAPTETPTGDAVTEAPVGTDSPTELPSVDTTATAAPSAGSDAPADAPTDAPVVDTASSAAFDTSDMLTEAPAITTEPPTKAPLPTVDDIDDDWEGSDSMYDDSDSTYDDSEESTEGK